MESQFKNLLSHFYDFAKTYLGLDREASINFVSDPINSSDALGKTAFYDPSNFAVTVYVDGRHPKDILRSISHELVHHRQNCQGKMSEPRSTEPGYAQSDKHLRGLEKEAYLVGNMCFRDWEDKYKANREIKTIYESIVHNFIKERISMKSKNELRNIVKEAVTKVLNKRSLEEYDRYGDEFASDEDDAYFADLAKEFPDMGLGDEAPAPVADAPADVQAAMDDEFGSKEEPEEEVEEALSPEQEKMDLDDDGKIEGEDLAGLRAGKKDDDVGSETNEVSMYPTAALIDILKTDPEFDLLASRADDVMTNMKNGMTDEEALEAAYPDWVPGQLLRAALEKAKSGHSIPNKQIAEKEDGEVTETTTINEIDTERVAHEVFKTVRLLTQGGRLRGKSPEEAHKEITSVMSDVYLMGHGSPESEHFLNKMKPEEQMAIIQQAASKLQEDAAMGAGAVQGGAAQSFETEEDFYSQMRDEARTISEDWNKSARNKRSQMLNERLMKAWKYTK